MWERKSGPSIAFRELCHVVLSILFDSCHVVLVLSPLLFISLLQQPDEISAASWD